MRTRRAEASSPNSDPQYFWNEYLQKWTDLGVNCIAEAHLPLCREKPSTVNFKQERIRKLNIDLRADSLKRWTEQEKELFTQRFIEVGKDFPLIADALPSKTVAQCIQYYYLTKHRFSYKKLRKKAIDVGNGIRSRRAKSCGSGKESKILSQRLGNGERNAKGKLRKTYSCPVPNILKSKETLENNKSRTNGDNHSTEDTEEPNTTGSQNGHRKGPGKDFSTGIADKNGINTRQRKLIKGIHKRKGSTKLITTHDQCSNISNYMNNQEPSVKISNDVGHTRHRSAETKTNGEPSYHGKLNKRTRGERNDNDSTNKVLHRNSNHQSSDVKGAGDSNTENNQDKVGTAETSQSHLSNACCQVKAKRMSKLTNKTTHRSYEKIKSRASCSGGKDVILNPSFPDETKKISCFKEYGIRNKGKCFKKLKINSFDMRLGTTVSSEVNQRKRFKVTAEEDHKNEDKIKRTKKRTRTWEDLNDDNCCSASKRKSIVEEVRNHEHKHSYDGGEVTTRKRKRCRADVQIKVSKKPRKSDTAGHFSGHDNALSQTDGEAGRSRVRKRNSAGRKLFSKPTATIDQFSNGFDYYLSNGTYTDEVPKQTHAHNEN